MVGKEDFKDKQSKKRKSLEFEEKRPDVDAGELKRRYLLRIVGRDERVLKPPMFPVGLLANRARRRLSELLDIDGVDKFGPEPTTRAVLTASK